MKKIDIHNHYYPAEYIDILKTGYRPPNIESGKDLDKLQIFSDKIVEGGQTLNSGFCDIEEKIDRMDEAGIDRVVLSLGNPWADHLEGERHVEVAKEMNNIIYKTITGHPDRFSGMGILPLKNIDAAINELDRLVKDLQMEGALIGSNIDGTPLDCESFLPFYEKADKLGVSIYVHPRNPFCIEYMAGYDHVLPIALGFTFETTLALARMILSGLLDKYNNINFVGSHAGGTLPYLMGRLDLVTDQMKHGLEKKPSKYIKENLYYDTIINNPQLLQFCINTIGSERLLFGTDDPFFASEVKTMVKLIESLDISEKEKSEIFSTNAKKLLNI